MTALWIAAALASVGSYALKLAGLSLPASALAHPRVQQTSNLLPVAMLAALVVVQLFDHKGSYGIDWHTVAGVVAAVLALTLRRGFVVVFLVAIGVTAALRLVT